MTHCVGAGQHEPATGGDAGAAPGQSAPVAHKAASEGNGAPVGQMEAGDGLPLPATTRGCVATMASSQSLGDGDSMDGTGLGGFRHLAACQAMLKEAVQRNQHVAAALMAQTQPPGPPRKPMTSPPGAI